MVLGQAILATLAYHDIFDYPLTTEEIQRYLIGKRVKHQLVKKELGSLLKSQKVVDYFSKTGSCRWYVLAGRQELFTTRSRRQKYSRAKFKKALLFSKILRIIPTLKLVAVSGALAMENSHKGDDIDLVLVTAKGWLWTTRFLANSLLWPFRRKPSSRNVTNRACLNLFIDESALTIKPQNLYQAHEICQMKSLWDRGQTYSEFIHRNQWVYKFLPNWEPDAKGLTSNDQRKREPKALVISRLALVVEPLEAFSTFVALAEKVAKWGQIWYMHPKITTEKIRKNQLFFHPVNSEDRVMKKYQKRLKKLGIEDS